MFISEEVAMFYGGVVSYWKCLKATLVYIVEMRGWVNQKQSFGAISVVLRKVVERFWST